MPATQLPVRARPPLHVPHTESTPRPRDVFTCTITGARVGPTDDRIRDEIHHGIMLARFTSLTGCEPAREQVYGHRRLQAAFESATTRIKTTISLHYTSQNQRAGVDVLECLGIK
jgi:hypothetical protein